MRVNLGVGFSVGDSEGSVLSSPIRCLSKNAHEEDLAGPKRQ